MKRRMELKRAPVKKEEERKSGVPKTPKPKPEEEGERNYLLLI